MEDGSTTIKSSQIFLGNKLSRTLLRHYTGKNPSGNIFLDQVLKEYFNGVEGPAEKLRNLPVALLLDTGRKAFGVDKRAFKQWFQDPPKRRGLVNALRSIGEYGITRPQKFSAPFLVVWNYTNSCNLGCRHCYQKAGEVQEEELSTEERLAIVDQLIHEEVAFIAFSGGEPLLREDLYKVAARASEGGIYVSIATNGTLLTEERVKKLVNHGVKYVQISLDSPNPNIHDDFRGARGAWDRTVRGIKNCVQSPLETTIATTITRHNYEDFEGVIALAQELGVDKVVIYNFIPTGRGKEIVNEDLTPEMREELLQKEYEFLEKGYEIITTAPQLARVCFSGSECGPMAMGHFASGRLNGKLRNVAELIGGCGAGRAYCAIQPNGEVTPCVFLPLVAGNLREENFLSIWKNSKVLNSLRSREDLKGGCKDCNYRYVCGGCRARGYAYFSDIKAPDTGCISNQQWWEEIAQVE